jgi:hypothetical protein
MYDVVYSYDCNCLRAIPRKGNIECIPFNPNGRRLKYDELRAVAINNFGEQNIRSFYMLRPGEGYQKFRSGDG